MSQGLFSGAQDVDLRLAYLRRMARWQEPRLPPIQGDPLPFSLLFAQDFHALFGGLERAFLRRYQVFRRKGHYWLERRDHELWRAYSEKLAAFYAEHDPFERATEIDAWFRAERNEIARERRRCEEDAMKRFCARTGRPPGRAGAARERRAERRERRWARWASACAEAIRKGRTPPPAPGARARSGAPVRRLCRVSVNPAPSPEALKTAFEAARGNGRVAEKIRCGSLLLDLEATVDSSLVRTATGEIVGRRPGLRGWIGDHLPGLLAHYASLMQYRRLAHAFREAHGLRDPHPAAVLLDESGPRSFPQPLRGRLEQAGKNARAMLASGAGRTMKDLRAALERREWRRTG